MMILFLVFLNWFLISLLIYKIINSHKRRLADVLILAMIFTSWFAIQQLVALIMLFVVFNYTMATIIYLLVSFIGAFISRNMIT